MEVYVRCPLKVCIQRETKRKATFDAPTGIYKNGFTGGSSTVPGVNVPYEEPLHPEVIVESDRLNTDQCVQMILEVFEKTFSRLEVN